MVAEKGAVAAGHPLTAKVAHDILSAGGNAYDAMVGAIATACVCEPLMASFGGGGFFLSYSAEKKASLIDFFVKTPGQHKPNQEINFFPIHVNFGSETQEFYTGKASAAVPGTIKGLFDIHNAYCSMPISELLEPAIHYARGGIEVVPFQAYVFDIIGEIYKSNQECHSYFGSTSKQGELLQSGDIHKQTVLADFMDALVREGPDLFYKGEIAEHIENDMNEGGLITKKDLETYETVKRDPIGVNYKDKKIYLNPPPSIGGTLITFGLALLKDIELNASTYISPKYLVLLAQVLEKTSIARNDIEQLSHNESILSILNNNNISKNLTEIRQALGFDRGTTHISIIDKKKNCASVTLSNGEGSGYVVKNTGVVLNNMLGELNPTAFENFIPNQFLSSMMSPCIIDWKDGALSVLGSGGSNRIRSAILQTILNLVNFGFRPEIAVDLPRLHFENNELSIEGGYEKTRLEELLKDYENRNIWEDKNMFFGGVNLVGFNKSNFYAKADARRQGFDMIVSN